jgi:hypothetical protein
LTTRRDQLQVMLQVLVVALQLAVAQGSSPPLIVGGGVQAAP